LYGGAGDAWRYAASLCFQSRFISVQRIMIQDYETRAYIRRNLEDALGELTWMLEAIRPDAEIDETEFGVRMAHLYSHLNTAWNVRDAGAREIDAANREQLNAWERFPMDIEPS
jgi:hypothetical protein